MRLTHADRVVFAETGITKQVIADYHEAVADWMLPDLVRASPVAVAVSRRAPTRAASSRSTTPTRSVAGVAVVTLEEKDGERDEYLYVERSRGVLELVQMNAIEFHPWGSRVDDPEQPDRLVFDLDPAPGIDWKTS